jgi:hypothetical protein
MTVTTNKVQSIFTIYFLVKKKVNSSKKLINT